MPKQIYILTGVLLFLAGCSNESIRRGTPITHVQFDYGLPDVISDRSGDLERFYVPSKRPEEEWPADAPRTFYYVQRNLTVTFVSGKVVKTSSIDPQRREEVILPLIQRRGVAESSH